MELGPLSCGMLQMCILDGKAYAAQQDAGREQYEEDVEACIIATNNQGKELLVPGRGATHNEDKWVVVQLSRGQAHLPDLTVTGKPCPASPMLDAASALEISMFLECNAAADSFSAVPVVIAMGYVDSAHAKASQVTIALHVTSATAGLSVVGRRSVYAVSLPCRELRGAAVGAETAIQAAGAGDERNRQQPRR